MPQSKSTCRDEVLAAVYTIITAKGTNRFTVEEVVRHMRNINTRYKESTIRTHITSRCCVNAPKNHGVVYNDFERLEDGVYKLHRINA